MNKKNRIRFLLVFVVIIVILIGLMPTIVKIYKYNKIHQKLEYVYDKKTEYSPLSSEIIVINSHGVFNTLVQVYSETDYYLQGEFKSEEDAAKSNTNIVCYNEKEYIASNGESFQEVSDICSASNVDDAYAIYNFINYENLSISKFDYFNQDGVTKFVLKKEYLSDVAKEWRSQISYVSFEYSNSTDLIMYIESQDSDATLTKIYVNYDFDRFIEIPEQIKTGN